MEGKKKPKIKMKKYPLIPPVKKDYCVCSVLQGILRENDIQISQDEIAINLTPAKKGFKVDLRNLKEIDVLV